MSKVDTNKVIRHLDEKWEEGICRVCGSRDWSVTDRIFELREFDEGNVTVGVQVVPVVPIFCKNCGNTIFINAKIAELLEE